jgi:hypothetical protein
MREGVRCARTMFPHPEAARAGTVEIAEPRIPPRIQSLFPTHCLMLQPLFLSPRRKEAQT